VDWAEELAVKLWVVLHAGASASGAVGEAPRGVWPDGTPVTDEHKRATYRRYERDREAFYGQPSGRERLPIYAALEAPPPEGQTCRWW